MMSEIKSTVTGAPVPGSFEVALSAKIIYCLKLTWTGIISQKSIMLWIFPLLLRILSGAWSQDGFFLAMQIATIGGS